MRVLHLDAGKQMGGGQLQVMRLIEGLEAQGNDCTLLARGGCPLYVRARQQGWRVEPLSLARVARYARKHDVVHAHDARTHLVASLTRGAPLIVARRVAFPIGPGISSKWKYKRARRYIAVSEFVKGVLAAGGVAAEKISVVYDGVPLLDRVPGRQTILAPHGKTGAIAEEAARLAGVELKVSTDLERDLPHAAIVVYVSHSEGLGSGVLLAMGAGAAVIASKTGGLSEAIEHGRTGMLVENRPEAFAEALRELSGSSELTLRLGLAARETVEKRFTVDRMVRRTMEVYREVLS